MPEPPRPLVASPLLTLGMTAAVWVELTSAAVGLGRTP